VSTRSCGASHVVISCSVADGAVHSRMRKVSPNFANHFVLTLKVLLFLALAGSCSAALDSDRTIAQFAHTAWRPKDGAPSVINVLAQSADGYLWLGSTDGLYRFDGVVFERYQPQSGDPFPTQDVRSLLALPNGDLWIGFRPGEVSLLRNGNATTYTTRDGVLEAGVRSFAQDRDGTIWAATSSGLARLEGNQWKKVGKDWNFPGKSARAIFLDRQGTLWVSTEDTLVFLPPALPNPLSDKRLQHFAPRSSQSFVGIAKSAAGS
jgi:ligand-binding sensor domain-containing protein